MAKYKYSISKSKEIDKILKKKVSEQLETIGKEVAQKVKEYIERYWYNTYTPQDYERTDSLKNSVKYRVRRSLVDVYIDPNEFIYALGEPGKWGQHIGFDGEKFGKGLMEFIEYGKFESGATGYKKNPRIGDATHVIKKLNTWLKRYVDDRLKRRLRQDFGLKKEEVKFK